MGKEEEEGTKEEIPAEVKALFAPNEKILYQTKQKGSKFKPDLKKRMYPNMLFVTDRRILYFQPRGLIRGALGMQDYTDYPYDGMRNIEIKKGTFRSTLLIYRKSRLQDGKNPFISDIDNKEAQDIYGIVRQILERKETTMASPAPIAVSTPQTETASPIEQLKELAKLKESGIISEEEFQEKKKDLLKKI
jgi:hypothetical protein